MGVFSDGLGDVGFGRDAAEIETVFVSLIESLAQILLFEMKFELFGALLQTGLQVDNEIDESQVGQV